MTDTPVEPTEAPEEGTPEEEGAEEEDDEEAHAAPVVDDVLSPELVEMYNPDAPTGPDGEPVYSSTSRTAFDQIWAPKGWTLRPDPYARPAEEQEPPAEPEAEPVAQQAKQKK